MAVITTGGSGDWASTTPNAPWPGGTLPTTSDTVVIAGGHTVTVSDSQSTWGTSPPANTSAASSADVVLTVTGTLTIQSTGTLTVRGSINGAGTLNVNSTTGLIFDASSALSPSAQNYSLKMTGGTFSVVGAAGARALVNSNDATGGRGFLNSGNYATTFTYARFYKMGVAGASSNPVNWQNSTTGACDWDYVEWDTCARCDMNIGAAVNFDIRNVTWKNGTTTTFPPDFRVTFTAATSGTRVMKDIISSLGFYIAGDPKNLDLNGLAHSLSATGNTSQITSTALSTGITVSNLLVYAGNGGNSALNITAAGTYDGLYCITDGFHTWDAAGTRTQTLTFKNWIAEDTTNNNGGDMLVPRTPAAGTVTTVNLQNCMTIPNSAAASTKGSGSLLAGAADQKGGWVVNITHCTQFLDNATGQGATYLTESAGNTGVGGKGLLGDFRSNLFWAVSGSSAPWALYQNGTAFQSAQKRNIDTSTNAGTITGATATTFTVTGGATKWAYTNATNNLFYNYANFSPASPCYIRILTSPRQQVVALTGQNSNVIGTVAAWTNGTPQVGDAWEIFLPDQADSTKLDYNGFYNVAATNSLYDNDTTGAGHSGYRYSDLYLTSLAGIDAHSVDLGTGASATTGGPKFVDPTRNAMTWQTTKGVGSGSPTKTTLFAEIAKCNDDSGRTLTGTLSANIADLIAYVQAGFAPTNTALKNAGHDGVTIGAVEGVWPSGQSSSVKTAVSISI